MYAEQGKKNTNHIFSCSSGNPNVFLFHNCAQEAHKTFQKAHKTFLSSLWYSGCMLLMLHYLVENADIDSTSHFPCNSQKGIKINKARWTTCTFLYRSSFRVFKCFFLNDFFFSSNFSILIRRTVHTVIRLNRGQTK